MVRHLILFIGFVSILDAAQDPFCQRNLVDKDPSGGVDHLTSDERARPMSSVESIYAVKGSDVNLNNLQNYIELPLRNAIHMLLEKNAPTNWASANKHNNGSLENAFGDHTAYSEVGLDWDGLSKENKAVVRALVPEELKFPIVGRFYAFANGQHMTSEIVSAVRGDPKTGLRAIWFKDVGEPERVRLFLPMTMSETVGELNDRWVEIAKKFKRQKPYKYIPPNEDDLMRGLDDAFEEVMRKHER